MLHEEFAPASRPRTESLLPCAPGTLGQLVTLPRSPLAYSIPVTSVERRKKQSAASLFGLSSFLLPSSRRRSPEPVPRSFALLVAPPRYQPRRSRSPRALRDHPSFCTFPPPYLPSLFLPIADPPLSLSLPVSPPSLSHLQRFYPVLPMSRYRGRTRETVVRLFSVRFHPLLHPTPRSPPLLR